MVLIRLLDAIGLVWSSAFVYIDAAQGSWFWMVFQICFALWFLWCLLVRDAGW